MITTVNSQPTEISALDALWTLYKSQSKKVRQALAKRILAEHEQSKTQAQQKMVKDSLTRAFDELHAGQVHKDARNLFKL